MFPYMDWREIIQIVAIYLIQDWRHQVLVVYSIIFAL